MNRNMDVEIGNLPNSNPMQDRSSLDTDGPIVSGFGWQDDQDPDIHIGRNSVMALTDYDAEKAFRRRLNTASMKVRSDMQLAMNNGELSSVNRFLLVLLILPFACCCLACPTG